MGYSETSKTYRIYIPALRSVMVGRDVRFEEERVDLEDAHGLISELEL